MDVKELFRMARAKDCSDLHITAGTALAIRRYGELMMLEDENDYIPTIKEAEKMILSILTPEQRDKVLEGQDIDVGSMLEDGSRIRANVYHQRNNLAASIRLLESKIPTIEELGLPTTVKKLAEMPRGLVLVTGPTGCGKSTTLASMLEHINHTQNRHILTIEDPIEYIYKHDKAMVHQREVGKDVDKFATALRSALREDPDVIMVGEMRDFETISAAITAAETGHLVLATLHTTGAAQTVERIIDGCPIDVKNQIRLQLANVLNGVITQQLIKRADGEGRIAATEILLNNNAVANLIRENKSYQITSTIQSNIAQGMHTLNHDLIRLIKERIITKEAAMFFSPTPTELNSI